MEKLKVLDLFSGIGGFSLGLQRTSGFETVAFCEIDKDCQKVLEKNFPNIENGENVEEIHYIAGKLKKLKLEQVDEAIKLYQSGLSLADVGDYFGVSRQAMHDLLKRRIELRPQKRTGKDNHFYRGGKCADHNVHNITEKAIKKGILKPSPCEECGKTGKMSDGRNLVQAHHDDYNKPLDVRWLCQPCHHEWHKNNKPIKRKEVREIASDIDVIAGGFPC